MKSHEQRELTAHEARVIAAEACVCERTVRRFIRGDEVRSTSAARIAQALERLNLAPSQSQD